MSIYQYEAKTLEGLAVKGKMEGTDEESITISLRKKNYFPVSIKEYNASQNIDLNKIRKVPVKDIAVFCRELSFSISAGMGILKALEIVINETENSKLKKILNSAFEELQKGKALSEALGAHKDIPEMLVHMIKVGEESGELDKVMERMADYYEKESLLNQKIKQALTYPILICIFALGVVIMLVTVILPKFIATIDSFGGGKLPLPTRIVLGISNAIRTQGILIGVVIIILIEAIRTFNRSKSGKETVDKLKLNMPIFGKINKKILTAKFARTFGTLMASSVPLIQSMNICSQVVGNKIATGVLLSAQENIRKGESIAEALGERNLFPSMLTQMIKIGEESGKLDVVLEKTAEYYDKEVDKATTQLTTLMEPMIIIVLAVLVGFTILSVVMPMFGMYDAVNNA